MAYRRTLILAFHYLDNHTEAFDHAEPNMPPAASTGPSSPRKRPPPGSSWWSPNEQLVPYLAPSTLDAVKRLVLDAVSSASTRPMYAKALDDFLRLAGRAGKSSLLPRSGVGPLRLA